MKKKLANQENKKGKLDSQQNLKEMISGENFTFFLKFILFYFEFLKK